MLEVYTKSIIENVVITFPTDFNENQKQSTIEVAENVELNILRIINEPITAVITYRL